MHEKRWTPRLQALPWPDPGLLHVPRQELVYLALSCEAPKGVLVSSLHFVNPPQDLQLVCLDDVGSGDKRQDIEEVQEDLPVMVPDAQQLHLQLLHLSA